MSMLMLVRSLLIYRITGSATMVGSVSLAAALPALLIALLGGAVADRTQKKFILLGCQMGSLITTGAIGISLVTGYLGIGHPEHVWVLLAAAVIDGAVAGFYMPTNTSIIPERVGIDRVMNGISLNQMGMNVFRLIGPTLAGFLVDKFSFAPVYFLMSGMYLVSIICTSFLPRTATKIVRGGNAMKDVVEGIKYLRTDFIILAVTLFGICHVVAGQPFNQLLPVFTESILKISATKLGMLNAISAAGALASSLTIASLPNKKRGLILLISGLIMAFPIIFFCIFPIWGIAIGTMIFICIGQSIHGALTSTLVQSYAKPEYRSRMQGLVTTGMSLSNLGVFFSGILADAVGVQWAVGGMAALLGIASLGFLILMKRFRTLN